ncbi:unnamed protein product [Angiostrongylus costaricensis]|uniref:Uncharacterized protein n=1 Tax=Angiostrongylus costaricensis TaxID=334426 RepID=A0A0R3PGJ9_ANGCS|nr:unnamed protein product [Angiostrongylus costaricensis]
MFRTFVNIFVDDFVRSSRHWFHTALFWKTEAAKIKAGKLIISGIRPFVVSRPSHTNQLERMENTAPENVGNVTKVYEEKQKMVHKDRLPALNGENHGDEQKHKLQQMQRNGGCITLLLPAETEKYSKSMLHVKVEVPKLAKAARAKHFCELIDYGSKRPDYVCVVMALLFMDLHGLRSELSERSGRVCYGIN